VAPDIGGVVHLALLRALSAHRRRRANDCRQGDGSDQQSLIVLPPYLFDIIIVIITSKLRPRRLSNRHAMVSTKIGQIFNFV
jgi:hypothetical protein